MSSLLVLATKAVVATLLALIAEGFRRQSSSPKVSYWLWGCVLAVLVIPAVIVVPLPEQLVTGFNSMIQMTSLYLGLDAGLATLPSSVREPAQRIEAADRLLIGLVLMTWLVVVVVLFWRRARGIRRLAQLVRHATIASERIRDRCRQLAIDLDVGHEPRVVTAAGRFSPFLWHPISGRACIVLPVALTDRLSAESLDAVFRHELVHLRRRDAWKHRAQFIVGTLWWWLPTASLARRRLLELEELCTDQEVVRANPRGAKDYALALLETEEFLSDAKCSDLFAVPAFTQRCFLRERIQYIISHQREAEVSVTDTLSYAAIGASLSLGLLTASLPTHSADNFLADREKPLQVDHSAAETAKAPPNLNNLTSPLPDSDSVEVCRTDREIVLAWPRIDISETRESIARNDDGQKFQRQTIRLIRISEDGVEPRLWKIDREDDPQEGISRLDDREVDWLFEFLALNNDIIDCDGKRHHHPGRVTNVA